MTEAGYEQRHSENRIQSAILYLTGGIYRVLKAIESLKSLC